jgi:hypothetical protein
VCAWEYAEENSGCTVSDAEGEYRVEDLPPGTYEVEFWAGETGHWSKYETGIVEAGGTTVLDVELEPWASIGGVVRVEGGLVGAAGVEVCAYPVGEEGQGGCAETDSSGAYSIGRMTKGEYKVEFWSNEYNLAVQFYNHKDRWDDADLVHVAEGEAVEDVNADLVPGATITGTVTSASTGQPLDGIEVCTVEAPSGELWICGSTGEKGTYRLGRHSSGVYKVVFSPEATEFFESAEPGEDDDGYPTQFWNDQSTLAAATPISLATGQSVTGVDAKLGPPSTVIPPVQVSPVLAQKPKKCGHGFQRRKIRGKFRCVERHHAKHRHRRHHRRHAGRGRVERFLGR